MGLVENNDRQNVHHNVSTSQKKQHLGFQDELPEIYKFG